MAWKIEGKIAGFFPNAGGQAQQDAYRIAFKDAAGTMYEIEKVYFLSPNDITYFSTLTAEQKLAELASGKYDVWHRYFAKTLLAGTQFVSFEFIPSADITVSQLGIFTADTYSGNVNFAIYHESGLVVAKSSNDTPSSAEEKYELTGNLRTVSLNNVVLKRGLKYYIQYTDQNGNTIHPAYFQDSQSSEIGETGKYKVFTHNQAQTKSIADLSNVSSYIGVVSDIDNFIAAPTGALMIVGSLDNYTQNYAYIRNSSYHESYQNIGTGSNLTLSMLDAILKLNDGMMFYWNGGNYYSLNRQSLWYKEYHRRIGTTYSKNDYIGILPSKEHLIDPSYSIGDYGSWDNGYGELHIFRKKADADVDTYIDLTDAKYTNKENYKTADVIKASYNASGNKSVMTQGVIFNQTVNSHVFTLKAGYTYDFTVDNDGTLHGYTISNAPSQWVVNRIYYCEETGNYPGGGYAPAGSLCLWTGEKLETINYYSYGMPTVFDIETDIVSQVVEDISLADMTQELGDASIFRTNEVYSTNYISEGLRNSSIEQDTKKFYLEINGNEV